MPWNKIVEIYSANPKFGKHKTQITLNFFGGLCHNKNFFGGTAKARSMPLLVLSVTIYMVSLIEDLGGGHLQHTPLSPTQEVLCWCHPCEQSLQ